MHLEGWRIESSALSHLCKAAWGLFVFFQVATGGLLFLVVFYVCLSAVGNLGEGGARHEPWINTVHHGAVPAGFMLLAFLASHWMSELWLALSEEFRPTRCPRCSTQLAPEQPDSGVMRVCPSCGAKL